MKRPFALLGGSAFAALILAALCGAPAAQALAWVFAGLGFCALSAALYCRFSKKLSARRGPRAFSVGAVFAACALLTAAGCLGAFAVSWESRVAPAQALAGERARVRATVLDFPEQAYHRSYYLLRVEQVRVEEETKNLPAFTARISTGIPLDCQPCDTLECTVKFSAFDSSGGLYSTRNSRLADGVTLGGYLSDYQDWQVLPGGYYPPGKLAALLRRRIGRGFEKRLPAPEAGLIRAMLLGEGSRIPDSAALDYRSIGSSHLLVISGLHVAAVAGLLFLLLGRLPLRRRAKNLGALAGILGYLLLIGFPVSATRAGVMYGLMLLGGCLGRRTDGVNSLGAAVFLICLCQPFAGGDLGFALSVLATLGVLVLARPIRNALLRPLCRWPRLQRLMGPVAGVLAATAAAQLFTLPIQIAVFRGLSLMTPVAGLLLALPCILLLYCGALAAVFGLIPFLAGWSAALTLAAGGLARLSLSVAALLARFPGFFLDFSRPAPLLAAGFLLVLAGIAVGFRKSRAVVSTAVAGMAMLCVCGVSLGRLAGREVITLIALPDSSCVAALRGQDAVVLSLGGYRTGAAEQLLRRNNVRRVEALCLPLRDRDAREAAVQLLDRFPVERLVLPEGATLGRDLRTAGGNGALRTLGEGETLTLLGGMEVTASQGMARLTVTANGVTAVIETGDTGVGDCQILFTSREGTAINSALSILQNGGIIEESEPGLEKFPPGNYLLPAGDGVALDLLPDGTVRIRGETHG